MATNEEKIRHLEKVIDILRTRAILLKRKGNDTKFLEVNKDILPLQKELRELKNNKYLGTVRPWSSRSEFIVNHDTEEAKSPIETLSREELKKKLDILIRTKSAKGPKEERPYPGEPGYVSVEEPTQKYIHLWPTWGSNTTSPYRQPETLKDANDDG